MHVLPPQRQGTRLPTPQSARHLVRAPNRSHPQWRFRGHIGTVTAATLVARHAGLRLQRHISMPRLGTRHAHQADRHRTLQVRRVQEQRVDPARSQFGLLDEGPTLSRCHRVAHRAQPLDAHSCLRGRRIRPDANRRHYSAPPQRLEKECAKRRLFDAADQRDHAHAGQPRAAAIRQPRAASRHAAEPRPAGIHRHPHARQGKLAVNMMPPPEGIWDMPIEELKKLPSYGDPVVQREAARKIMAQLGYGPNNKLKVKVATRDFNSFRDAAVILVDQLNKIYFDAELDVIESSLWYSRLFRKDYSVALNLAGAGIDDPDAVLKMGFACKSEANFSQYCNAEVERLLDQQSQEPDAEKRKALVWRIERILVEDVARPIIFHNHGATCWHSHFKGHVQHENSIYNNWRFDNVWFDK